MELKSGEDAERGRHHLVLPREPRAASSAPRPVEFCELPRTGTGKIQKYVLREREWAGREKAIG